MLRIWVPSAGAPVPVTFTLATTMSEQPTPESFAPLPPEARTFRAAKQFSVAAGAIAKHTKIGETPMFAVQPFITCAAFSIELYLKCILIIENGKEVRGHQLKQLFDKLTGAGKTNLLFYLRGAYANLDLPMSFLEKNALEIDNAFVEWRYVHEKESAKMNVEFLRKFAWSCQMHVRYLRPEWFPENDPIPPIGG